MTWLKSAFRLLAAAPPAGRGSFELIWGLKEDGGEHPTRSRRSMMSSLDTRAFLFLDTLDAFLFREGVVVVFVPAAAAPAATCRLFSINCRVSAPIVKLMSSFCGAKPAPNANAFSRSRSTIISYASCSRTSAAMSSVAFRNSCSDSCPETAELLSGFFRLLRAFNFGSCLIWFRRPTGCRFSILALSSSAAIGLAFAFALLLGFFEAPVFLALPFAAVLAFSVAPACCCCCCRCRDESLENAGLPNDAGPPCCPASKLILLFAVFSFSDEPFVSAVALAAVVFLFLRPVSLSRRSSRICVLGSPRP